MDGARHRHQIPAHPLSRRRARRCGDRRRRCTARRAAAVVPHVKSVRVRVLALTPAKRSSAYPDWKTLQDLGVPEVDASNWVGMFAPKATPQPIVDKLNAEVAKVLAMPDIKERFAAGGAETVTMTTAALDARVRADSERLKVVVERGNVKPD